MKLRVALHEIAFLIHLETRSSCDERLPVLGTEKEMYPVFASDCDMLLTTLRQ